MAHPLAGKLAPSDVLTDIPALLQAYRSAPDVTIPAQRVAFGTSGHRGSALARQLQRGAHPRDHAGGLRVPARPGRSSARSTSARTPTRSPPRPSDTALEVLAANVVRTHIQADGGYTPTPVVSHAILAHNRTATLPRADGIVITPSHNPPQDGGIKYNPPHGGPADTDVTGWIERRANAPAVARQPRRRAGTAQPLRAAPTTTAVEDLAARLHRGPGLGHRHGGDPQGQAAHRRRPAGRRGGRVLEADRRALRPRHRRGQSAGRSGLRVHDPRPRRQDPDGLLQPLRDGEPGRAQGPLRHRLGQRRRRRSPRHRHAVRPG